MFESSFLKLYEVDSKTRKEIRKDEIALLQFGIKWLKWLLFKEGEFKVNPQEAAKRGQKRT